MSCTTNNKPYFKIGDSFDVPIQMIDTLTGEAVEITVGLLLSTLEAMNGYFLGHNKFRGK